MNKAFAPLLVSALILAFAAHAEDKPDAGAPVATGKDYVMLKVNGEDIKKSEVDDAWKEAGKYIFQGRDVPSLDSMGEPVKDKFLREMASERALYKEAQKEGIENSPDVQAEFEKLKRQAVIQELLKDKTKDAVTDDKLKASYDEHIKTAVAANGGRDEVHARHILVKTKEAADAIEKDLKAGKSFEKIAKEKSEDKATGAQGGDLGWFNPEKMVPEFTAGLMKLKKGEISAPVKTDFGWHIIQMEDSRSLPAPPFSDVKGALKQEVGNKAIGEYVNTVMKSVKITKLDPSGHETDIPSVVPEKKESAPAAKDDKDGSSD